MKHNYSYDQMGKNGVYKITSLIDGRIYIGSAASINVPIHKRGFRGRIYGHLLKLKLNKHRNNILQNYFNKYGEESFKLEILEICISSDCKIREQHYLDLLQPYGDLGFNICRNALSYNGKQAKRRVQNNNQKEICKHLGVPVLQFDLQDNFIQEFYSVAEAARQTNICRVQIYKICRNNPGQKTAGGFKWKYKFPENIKPITVKKFLIKVTNVLNNIETTYKTWQEVSNAIDFCKSTLLIHANNSQLIENQFLIERLYM